MKSNGWGRIAVTALATGAACLLWTAGSATAGPVRAGQTRSVTCGALTGINSDDHRLTLSGCTGPTGGSGTFQGPIQDHITVHWASGLSSEVNFDRHGVRRRALCPGEFKVVGKVTETSVKGFARSFKGLLCIDSTRHVTLAPSTRIKF